MSWIFLMVKRTQPFFKFLKRVLCFCLTFIMLSEPSLSFAGAPAEEKIDAGISTEELSKYRLTPPAAHVPLRRSVPGLKFSRDRDSSRPSSPTTLIVDENLRIQFPKHLKQAAEFDFLFQPYSQEFIYANVNLNHVALAQLEKLFIRLEYRNNAFLKTVRLAIQIGHYRELLTQHPIFQLKSSFLGTLNRIERRFQDWILKELQLQPLERLKKLKVYLIKRQFEDIFVLGSLYRRIQKHLEPEALGHQADLLDWFQSQGSKTENKDALWTYYHFLDRNPEEILKQVKNYLQALIFENLQEVLHIGSKTYLEEAESLLESLSLMGPPPSLVRNTQLELEVSRLQFEPYREFPTVYNRLMEVYSTLPNTSDYFQNQPQKARVFFHFFDQLLNHGITEYERGELECKNPIKNRENCLLHWQESLQFLKYVARHSPFGLLSTRSVDLMEKIQTHQKLEYPLISRSDLLEMMDYRAKPHP